VEDTELLDAVARRAPLLVVPVGGDVELEGYPYTYEVLLEVEEELDVAGRAPLLVVLEGYEEEGKPAEDVLFENDTMELDDVGAEVWGV